MSQLSWAVAGLGVGYQHARVIHDLKAANLTAICDRDPAILSLASLEFPEARSFVDVSTMLDECDLDAIVIATFDSSHGPLVIECLKRGLHVFVEKPVATSRRDLTEIVEVLNRNRHLRLTTNTLLRLSPRFQALKAMISSGEMGRIFHSELTYLYGRLEKVVGGWRGESPDYSVTLGGAIHMIDLLLWLTGEVPQRCVAIRSNLGTISSALNNSREWMPPDDLRVAMLQFASGMTAQVGANYACVLPHFHSVAVFGSRQTFLHLPHETQRATPGALVFADRNSQQSPVPLALPYPAVPKGALIPLFADSIFGGRSVVTEQEAIEAIAVAFAIDEAATSGESVEVAYPQVKDRQLQVHEGT